MQSMHTYRAWTNKEGHALGRTQHSQATRFFLFLLQVFFPRFSLTPGVSQPDLLGESSERASGKNVFQTLLPDSTRFPQQTETAVAYALAVYP